MVQQMFVQEWESIEDAFWEDELFGTHMQGQPEGITAQELARSYFYSRERDCGAVRRWLR
jgi:hypothetical protein